MAVTHNQLGIDPQAARAFLNEGLDLTAGARNGLSIEAKRKMANVSLATMIGVSALTSACSVGQENGDRPAAESTSASAASSETAAETEATQEDETTATELDCLIDWREQLDSGEISPARYYTEMGGAEQARFFGPGLEGATATEKLNSLCETLDDPMILSSYELHTGLLEGSEGLDMFTNYAEYERLRQARELELLNNDEVRAEAAIRAVEMLESGEVSIDRLTGFAASVYRNGEAPSGAAEVVAFARERNNVEVLEVTTKDGKTFMFLTECGQFVEMPDAEPTPEPSEPTPEETEPTPEPTEPTPTETETPEPTPTETEPTPTPTETEPTPTETPTPSPTPSPTPTETHPPQTSQPPEVPNPPIPTPPEEEPTVPPIPEPEPTEEPDGPIVEPEDPTPPNPDPQPTNPPADEDPGLPPGA